jgi:predicted N-acetyltransferase YhbS
MNIRKAMPEDQEAISSVHKSAFPEEEWELIANLATELLDTDRNAGTVSWVADMEGEVVGKGLFIENAFAFGFRAPKAAHILRAG